MKYFLVIGWLVVAPPGFALAETAEEKGLAIAIEDDQRDNGFVDYQANLEMILKNRHGEESVRYMRSKNLEVLGDGDKSLIVFDRPRDIKGTALLNFFPHRRRDSPRLLLRQPFPPLSVLQRLL